MFKMIKKLLLLILLIPLLSFSQGLIPASVEDYNNVPSVRFDNQFGFTESIPEFYSLESYVPPVLSQEGNSCTGFSIFYYGLSTQYNVELNITNSIDKTGHSFDPYFGYTIVNQERIESSEECDATNTMIEVLDILKSKGAKKQFYTPHIECDSSFDESLSLGIKNYTNPYSIFDYEKIPALGGDLAVNNTKKQLLNNKPILLSARFPNNFEYSVQNDGNYSPSDSELNNVENVLSRRNSGFSNDELNEFKKNNFDHAVTIIGYDDNIYGGAFRVVNSWGYQWGDDGYFWLKYKDFKILGYEAYVLDLLIDVNPKDKVQFSFDNYKRINYGNGETYEGEFSNDMFNGQGIYSYDSEVGRVNVIGNWNDSIMDGFFAIVNSDNEIYFGIYENGKYVENNAYGFFDEEDEEDLEKRKKKEKFIEYWKKYGGDKKIRRSKTVIIKVKKTI